MATRLFSAATASASSTERNSQVEISLAALKGGTPQLLVANGCRPTFSPDGRHIAYYHSEGRFNDIWIADVSQIVGDPEIVPDREL